MDKDSYSRVKPEVAPENLRALCAQQQQQIIQLHKMVANLQRVVIEKDQSINELCGENMKQLATIEALEVKIREQKMSKDNFERPMLGGRSIGENLSLEDPDHMNHIRSPLYGNRLERVNASKSSQSTYDQYLNWNEKRKEQEQMTSRLGTISLTDMSGTSLSTGDLVDDNRVRRNSKSEDQDIDQWSMSPRDESGPNSARDSQPLSARTTKATLPPLPTLSPGPRTSASTSTSTSVHRRSRSTSPAHDLSTSPSSTVSTSYWWSGLSSSASQRALVTNDNVTAGTTNSPKTSARGTGEISQTSVSVTSQAAPMPVSTNLNVPFVRKKLVRSGSEISCQSISDIDFIEPFITSQDDDGLLLQRMDDSPRNVYKATSENSGITRSRVPALSLGSVVCAPGKPNISRQTSMDTQDASSPGKPNISRQTSMDTQDASSRGKFSISRQTSMDTQRASSPGKLSISRQTSMDTHRASSPSSTQGQPTARDFLDDDLLNNLSDNMSPRSYVKSFSEDVRVLSSYSYGKK